MKKMLLSCLVVIGLLFTAISATAMPSYPLRGGMFRGDAYIDENKGTAAGVIMHVIIKVGWGMRVIKLPMVHGIMAVDGHHFWYEAYLYPDGTLVGHMMPEKIDGEWELSDGHLVMSWSWTGHSVRIDADFY